MSHEITYDMGQEPVCNSRSEGCPILAKQRNMLSQALDTKFEPN